ncbi:PQQ-binding-like beta-propeller repeat protein [Natrinema sp. SYSU A 869]|uniref:PQQ-binding-like beta-propeller repeat protein n=1 Tax=Natrinema sp. SYSU A 869 TaxID=2871694 RepID=UPI001CA3ECC8|nr:PQQ-binding-like beta-propeller repeat protein [Natrinema sp. SYSU A 869]
MTSDPRCTIYAVDLESGNVIRKWGSKTVFTAAVIDGTVFLGDGSSTVHAFSTEEDES